MPVWKRILGTLFCIYYVILYFPVTGFCAIGAIISALIVPMKYGYKLRVWARIWGRGAMAICFLRPRVIGHENLIEDGAVIISNHQSLFDIYAALSSYPLDFLFLAKMEARKIPFVGLAMHKVGYLFIERRRPIAAARSLEVVIAKIREGNNVLIYPEGTRSNNPHDLLPFKGGTIKTAKEGNLPILPIVLHGTAQVKPNNVGWFVWRHPITIQVLPAILPDNPLHPANADSIDEEREILEKMREMVGAAYSRLDAAHKASASQ